jgi:hypothetical protein
VISPATSIVIVGVSAQTALLALWALGIERWPWFINLLPLEALIVFVLGLSVYLVSTKSNPFQ